MPTVAELTHCSALPCLKVVDGFGGLAREICRVVRVSADRLDTSLHAGDLLLVSVAEWADRRAGGAASLIAEFARLPVAAVIVTGAGSERLARDGGGGLTPILIADAGPELDLLQHRVLDWLERRLQADQQVSVRLNEDLADLMRSGADAGELLDGLTQLTGKSVLLHDPRGRIRQVHQPASECISPRDLRAAVAARTGSADANLAAGVRSPRGVCALELPASGLTRLTVELEGGPSAGDYLSLIGRPGEISQRDRSALAAGAQVLCRVSIRPPAALPNAEHMQPESIFVIAIQSASAAQTDQVRSQFAELVGARTFALRVEEGHVIGVICAGSPPIQDWERHEQVGEWYAALSAECGPISLGYSGVHCGPGGLRRAGLEARQALQIGERIVGPGLPHAYSHVCLRRYLSRAEDPAELHALQEALLGPLVAHDRQDQVQLLPTLDVFLDSACVTKHAATRLQIHRNSVTYRLHQIESLAQVDLGDADTRLLLQLVLHARRR